MGAVLDRPKPGDIRRFGPVGPRYKILATAPLGPDREEMLTILVLETGEELAYRVSRAAADPLEA